jgi:hypothetical protein
MFAERSSPGNVLGEILEVGCKLMPVGGGRPALGPMRGAKLLELSKVPLPIPEVPQTLVLERAFGHGEKVDSEARLGERPNAVWALRSLGFCWNDGGLVNAGPDEANMSRLCGSGNRRERAAASEVPSGVIVEFSSKSCLSEVFAFCALLSVKGCFVAILS